MLSILVPEAEEAIKSQLELRKIIVEPIQEDIKGEFENLLFVNTKGKPVNVGSEQRKLITSLLNSCRDSIIILNRNAEGKGEAECQ